MKPPPFDYHRPRSRDEALFLLAEHGDGAKLLAGGQSLVPTMNFRLAQPSVLIDLNGVDDLAGIEQTGGGILVGAMTRQRAVEQSAPVRERVPLLSETMPFIAHPQIRNRGTVGGSIAHADPAAELPAIAVAAGARLQAQGPAGSRWIAADGFYPGLFTTALAHDELLTAIEFPTSPPRTGWAFDEVARRHGDYALVGAAAMVCLEAGGACNDVRIVLLSVGDGPVVAASAAQLAGEAPSDDAIRDLADAVTHHDVDPPGDIHASAAYRRQLTRVLTGRVLRRAIERAGR